MSLTCPISDIHDRIDLLELAIGKIVEYSAGERAAIVTLGDYVDRGPVALRNSRERAFFVHVGHHHIRDRCFYTHPRGGE